MNLKVYIEPIDTVFFRDNRPFDAGIDTFADTVLPSPLVLFGVIGSYYLNAQGVSLGHFMSNGHVKLGRYDYNLEKSKLKIKGPFLKFGDEIFFPPPSNIWVSGLTPYILKPKQGDKPQWDIPHPNLLPLDIPRIDVGTQPEPLAKYISLEVVKQYLSAGEIDLFIGARDENDFFLKENRYGHELNPSTLTVKEGQLYISKHLRFTEKVEDKSIKKATFMLSVEGLDMTDFAEMTTPVGGEGRIAKIYAENASDRLVPCDDNVLNKIKEQKQFFIYFITPSIFKNGWYGWPSDFNGAELAGAYVNKPVFISGWQKSGIGSKGTPRSLLKAVPAGSVYFFKASNWDDNKFDEIYKKYHFNDSLSDYYPCAGFGIALIGKW